MTFENLSLGFGAWEPSQKMRLDESFHMRYTMPQNTLLVTILKHFSVLAVGRRPVRKEIYLEP